MKCPSVETLSDLLDKALPLKARWQVSRHARYCASCTRHLAAEAKLKEQAATVAAKTMAPAHLRARVFAAVPQPQVLTPRRPAPMLLAAALCSALVALTAWLLRPAVVPLPAFAQVVEAMQQIRTARWQEEMSTYDVAAKKVNRFVVTHSARLAPPALSTTYPPEPQCKVLTPALIRVERKAGIRIFSAPSFGFYSLDRSASATPLSVLREYILDRIIARRSRGGGSAAWKSHKETIEGRELLRFESKIGGKQTRQEGTSDSEPSRLTVPGYRYRIWADPNTLRVVKSDTEYYDGQKHSRTTCTNFKYDMPLPSDEFKNR